MLTIALFAACKGNVSNSEKEATRSCINEAIVIANDMIGGKQVDFMTFCDKVEFRNDNVYYYYTIDESYASISDVRNNINSIKEKVEMTFDTNPEAKELAEMVAKLNGKFVYKYTGDQSGESASFEIRP